MSCTLLLIVYYVSTFRHYFTSSKISTTDYQLLTETLVQIRNAISILNVINQQISRNIRVMLFLFFLVLFYIFLSFVCANVRVFFCILPSFLGKKQSLRIGDIPRYISTMSKHTLGITILFNLDLLF